MGAVLSLSFPVFEMKVMETSISLALQPRGTPGARMRGQLMEACVNFGMLNRGGLGPESPHKAEAETVPEGLR